MAADSHPRQDERIALTNLIGVRVWLGDRWVVVHRDDVELIFGDFPREEDGRDDV